MKFVVRVMEMVCLEKQYTIEANDLAHAFRKAEIGDTVDEELVCDHGVANREVVGRVDA